MHAWGQSWQWLADGGCGRGREWDFGVKKGRQWSWVYFSSGWSISYSSSEAPPLIGPVKTIKLPPWDWFVFMGGRCLWWLLLCSILCTDPPVYFQIRFVFRYPWLAPPQPTWSLTNVTLCVNHPLIATWFLNSVTESTTSRIVWFLYKRWALWADNDAVGWWVSFTS